MSVKFIRKAITTCKIKPQDPNSVHCFAISVYKMRRHNKTRTLYVPSQMYKELLKKINSTLQMFPIHPAAHGFVPGRNVVTNAMMHIGYEVSACFDIKDFYDSITIRHCEMAGIPEHLIEMVCVEGSPRQGMPTSPTVSNIVCKWMDYSLTRFAKSIDGVYTRYADDITISHSSDISNDDLAKRVDEIVTKYDFQLNRRKTHFLYARGGRRIICGVGVDDVSVYPTRKQKRRLRAAKHQASRSRTSKFHAAGLEEWVACKIPKERPQQFTDWLP